MNNTKVKLEVKRFRVPVKREKVKTGEPDQRGKYQLETKVSYPQIDLTKKEYYIDSEKIEVDGLLELNGEAEKVKSYNDVQLRLAKADKTINLIYLKVICKP